MHDHKEDVWRGCHLTKCRNYFGVVRGGELRGPGGRGDVFRARARRRNLYVRCARGRSATQVRAKVGDGAFGYAGALPVGPLGCWGGSDIRRIRRDRRWRLARSWQGHNDVPLDNGVRVGADVHCYSGLEWKLLGRGNGVELASRRALVDLELRDWGSGVIARRVEPLVWRLSSASSCLC